MIGNQIAGFFSVGTPPIPPTNYESISTVTLSGTQTYIDFTSIPSGYKHLQIRGIARGNYAATNLNLCIQVGNSSIDTGNSYTYHMLIGDGSSAQAYGGSAQSFGFVGRIAQASATSNVFGASVIDILDYTSANKNKTIRTLGGYDSSGNGIMSLMSSVWLNSSDPISKIRLFSNLGDLTQYSSFQLYGITGA